MSSFANQRGWGSNLVRIEVSSRAFEDVEEYREQLRGWDAEVTQLTRGLIQLRWDQIVFDDLVIAYHRSAGSYADTSALEPGMQGVVVCLSPVLRPIWCGLEVGPGSLALGGAGREHRARVPSGWETLEILMTEELFDRLGLVARAGLPRDLPPERSILPMGPAHLAAFHALARHLGNALQFPSTGEDLAMLLAVRERTLDLLTAAVEAGAGRLANGTSPVSRVARYDLAVRALALVDASPDTPLTLVAIASELGTTPRAIQYAFRAALGVSPYQYLLARRLQGARRGLRSGVQGRSPVTEVALDHGFENLSRFAQQYQRLFGEPPSATVRRAHARPERLPAPRFAQVGERP